MQTGGIKNNQLEVSSEAQGYEKDHSRLQGLGWCALTSSVIMAPGKVPYHYLQVDLVVPHFIRGVGTQGKRTLDEQPEAVTSFYLLYSFIGDEWFRYHTVRVNFTNSFSIYSACPKEDECPIVDYPFFLCTKLPWYILLTPVWYNLTGCTALLITLTHKNVYPVSYLKKRPENLTLLNDTGQLLCKCLSPPLPGLGLIHGEYGFAIHLVFRLSNLNTLKAISTG